MKYLVCLLLAFIYLGCHAQQSTRWQGDSTFSAQLQSDDTTKVKVYNNPLHDFECKAPSMDVAKYDTIGPVWRLVSDTAAGHWNPVSAMRVYEVREYQDEWVDNLVPIDGGYTIEGKKLQARPYHHAWLNSNRKPLKLAVWRSEIEK